MSLETGLAGKVVIVTGAGAGIGRATAVGVREGEVPRGGVGRVGRERRGGGRRS